VSVSLLLSWLVALLLHTERAMREEEERRKRRFKREKFFSLFRRFLFSSSLVARRRVGVRVCNVCAVVLSLYRKKLFRVLEICT
jgi:multidrug efflux pump subunit AcrB